MAMSITIDAANTLVGADVDTLVKPYLYIDDSDTDLDEQLKLWINAASWWISTETGKGSSSRRQLLAADLVETYSGCGDNMLIPRNYPINSTAAAIDIRDDLAGEFASTTKLSSDLIRIANNKTRIELYGSTFTEGVENVQLTYNAGYTTIPWDLQEACLELISMIKDEVNEKRRGLTQRQTPDGSTVFVPTRVPKYTQGIIDQYQRKTL